MLRLCIFGRDFDKKAISLQRRGKLGTFAPMSGQEAVVVGSVFALDREQDWVVPQYREQLAMLHWGLELSTYFLQRQGHPLGSTLPEHGRLFPQQVALAAHLPHAVGLAWGLKHQGIPAVAACYFGDGSTSEGDFHEACNLAGVLKAPVIFVCQNNQWAISTPLWRQTAGVIADRAAGYGIAGVRVDGNDALAMYQVTTEARERALAGDGPTLIEAVTYRLGAHTTADDPTRYIDPDDEARWRTRDPLIRAAGVDACDRPLGRRRRGRGGSVVHDAIDRAVAEVATAGAPAPEMLFDNVWADDPPGLAAQRAELLARPRSGGDVVTGCRMVEAVCSALGDEMERDERVIVLGEDVGKSGGVFRATDGLQKRFGAERVVDTPVSEAAIVGASIGLATAGLVPVAELQFLGFSLQAFHQIGHQLARWRYRTNGRYHAQVTIRAPYGGGVRTPELHSDGFEAMFAQMPGLKMVAPATAADAKGMLLSAIRDPDPVLFLEPLRGYRLVRDEVPDGDVTVPLGSARIARPGSDVTLVAWSAMTTVCLEAASAAAEVGIDAEVIDVRSLVPLDTATIADSVSRTGRAVVVQEAPLTAGFASEVVAAIQEGAFLSLEAPIVRVSGWDVPYPMPLVEDHYVPSVERVLAAIRRTVEY